MEIVKPSYEIVTPATATEGQDIIKLMERAARVCYKSEDKITEDSSSAKQIVKMLRDKNHEAMLEFGNIVVKFIIDRAICNELTRHRICSLAQESTRYVNYRSNGIQVICPNEIIKGLESKTQTGMEIYQAWCNAMLNAEASYETLSAKGCTPQIARSVLPLCTKTEIFVQGNPREWRHIFKMRTPITAHPDMALIMKPLLEEMKSLIPIVFDDI